MALEYWKVQLLLLKCTWQRRRKLHEAAGAETAERAPQGQQRSQYLRSEVVLGVTPWKFCVTTPF